MFMHSVHQVLFCQSTDFWKQNGNMQLQADAGQREYNIYKGQKKYPWSGSYTRSGKRKVREIN
jgi:hypothetical protein